MITVQFSCPKCGLKDHKFQIPARESEDASVVYWMKCVIKWCAEEHHRVSPVCNPDRLADLKIPLKHSDGTEAECIGQQIE